MAGAAADMKGPLAASMIAAAVPTSTSYNSRSISPLRPMRNRALGAHYMQEFLTTFKDNWPTWAVIPEPTDLQRSMPTRAARVVIYRHRTGGTHEHR
ncbi:MAG: hypothetical protein R2867_08240 [Caldilineaceae bacterium]